MVNTNITDHSYWAQARRYYPKEKNPNGYIYGIFDPDGKILYIGQTTSIQDRMTSHIHVKDKDVQVIYIEVPIAQMNDVEAKYILEFLPPLNKTLPKGTLFYTLDAYNKVDPRFYSQRVLVLSFIETLEIKGKHGYFKVKDLQRISNLLTEAEKWSGVNYDNS